MMRRTPLGIVEVKKLGGLGNAAAFDFDAARIRDLQKMLNPAPHGIVCGLVGIKVASSLGGVKSAVAHNLGLGETDIIHAGFTTVDSTGYYYGAIGGAV